ncbi:MAG: FtsX-like permease family protein [Dehalococcoidia bacterium]|jgi:putative ABC transport system permease protein
MKNQRIRNVVKSLKVAVFLAYKGIVRANIGVTLLTIFILILVALNLMFVPGLINGIVASANDKLINTYSSHLVIEAQGIKDQGYKITHVKNLMTAIQSINGVEAVTARNAVGTNISFKDKSNDDRKINCMTYGIMPEQEMKVFEVSDWLVEGSYLDDRDRDKILLGIQLAGTDQTNVELYSHSLRHVHAGDKVTITYNSGYVKQYTVKGIFRTGFIQTDLQAFITQLEYESIIPGTHDTATELHVRLDKDADPLEIMRRIAMFNSDVDFQTWQENAGIVNSMTTSFQLINGILDVVNALVAGITIFIITYVDVINKRRQIGIQRAIGIKNNAIIFAYLLRALCYVIVGLVVARLLFRFAIVPFEASHPFYFPFGAVYLALEIPLLIRTTVLLVIVSLVAAFIPVMLITRIKILDAIWG